MKPYIENKQLFKAFGLNILSDIPLPELSQIHDNNRTVDIVIKEKDLTSLWEKSSSGNKYFVIQKNTIMFRLPNNAIYMIQNGKEIYYSRVDNANEDQIRLYLLGTCMGALLIQRKILPLHGSAIELNGRAYAIVGESGAGKSTLASAFLKKGFRLISDDVIPVSMNEENIPVVTPAYPQQKLWIESLNEFEMESNEYRPIVDRETKFAIPVSNQFASEQLPLAGVIELVKNVNEEIELNPIKNLQRLHTLFNHTYRNFFIAPLGLMEWHFNTSAKMCEHIEMYQLRRPTTRFTAHDLTDLILTTINKEEIVYG